MIEFIFSYKFLAGLMCGGCIGFIGMALLAINRDERRHWD